MPKQRAIIHNQIKCPIQRPIFERGRRWKNTSSVMLCWQMVRHDWCLKAFWFHSAGGRILFNAVPPSWTWISMSQDDRRRHESQALRSRGLSRTGPAHLTAWCEMHQCAKKRHKPLASWFMSCDLWSVGCDWLGKTVRGSAVKINWLSKLMERGYARCR